jgi:hypothetical protein
MNERLPKEEEKERELEKCLDKHSTKPSIIYLVLFIEFPVYVCVCTICSSDVVLCYSI